MHAHQNRRARRSVQLQFSFSLPASPANEGEKSKADRGCNRYRPDNDDDVFAEPHRGIAAYGRGSANDAERIKG